MREASVFGRGTASFKGKTSHKTSHHVKSQRAMYKQSKGATGAIKNDLTRRRSFAVTLYFLASFPFNGILGRRKKKNRRSTPAVVSPLATHSSLV